MMIKEGNITVIVKDLDKSVLFYHSLGLQIKRRWNNNYAQLTAPGLIVGLHPTESTHVYGNSGNVSIGFNIDSIEEAKALLQKIVMPFTERNEEGGQFLHFTDPDGTGLYFIKPKW
jgi:catechol 2,3-dioxygenase-like lactoylglutathione lyase family enzyme